MTQRAICVVAAVLALAACRPPEPISVTNAWLRPPAPGLAVAAGYFDIVNRTAASIDLIGARAEAAASIEMHSSSHEGGMMQMRQLEKVALAPDQTVSFSPGGNHLMLFEFAGATSKQIPITLLFSDGSQRTVSFEARMLTGESPP